jgi:hypothetical protein
MNIPLTNSDVRRQKTDIDIVRIWRKLDTKVNSGRNSLVQLAIRILSIIANSASLERSWSKLGIIHTKLRNRMALEKARKTSILADELKRRHVEAGLIQNRRKRHFGEYDNAATPSPSQTPSLTAAATTPDDAGDADASSDDDEPVTFQRIAQQCMDDVDKDQDIADGPQSSQPVQRVFFGTREPIPLKVLFIYPPDHSKPSDLDFFKQNGIRNLEKELEIYDSLAADEIADLHMDES